MNNDQQLKEEVGIIKTDGESTRKLITDHIIIYQKNGKAIEENNRLIQESIRINNERWEKQQPMLENYQTIINGGKMIRGIAYFILAVGVIGTALYKFIK